jgi:hypothetical protein
MMPVVDGDKGIEKGRAFRRFDVIILIAASHLHHAFPSHMISVVNIPEGIKNDRAFRRV